MEAKKISKKKMLVAASVAGLLAMSGAAFSQSANAHAADVSCYGVNACKGVGDCGGKGNGCAGKNACKGQGWVNFPTKDLCAKVGGTLTAK